MKFNVIKVNAFTDSLDGGNPAGVVLNAPDLTDDEMKQVSRELDVSETSFVFQSQKADYKTRFFSPEVEVDLCGHATIATFFSMALKGMFPSNKNYVVTQETKAGVFPVYIEFEVDHTLYRIMMTQRKPAFHIVKYNLSEIAHALGVSENMINSALPKQVVSTGLFTLPICIKTFDVLKTITPNFVEIKNLCMRLKVGSFHVFTFETIESCSTYHARNFAPLYGVNEDPVTGTANGAVSSYLVKNRLITKKSVICEQGDIIGRPGRVFVEVDNDVVRVGGTARIVEEKSFEF